MKLMTRRWLKLSFFGLACACGSNPGPSGQIAMTELPDAAQTATVTPDAGILDAGFDPCPSAELTSIREKTFLPRCGLSGCHVGSATTAAGLNLTLEIDDLRTRLSQSSTQSPSRMKLVEPNRIGSSWLYLKIAFPQPVVGEQMPPNGALPKCEVEALADWISAGASD